MSDASDYKKAAIGFATSHARLVQALSFLTEGVVIRKMTSFCEGRGCKNYYRVPIPTEIRGKRALLELVKLETERQGWEVELVEQEGEIINSHSWCPACIDEKEEVA